jgi:peptidoglycan/LPS O-acetylase OafA/YrhL
MKTIKERHLARHAGADEIQHPAAEIQRASAADIAAQHVNQAVGRTARSFAERSMDGPSALPLPSRKPRLESLTSLRFFAALAIVVLHFRDLLAPLPPDLLKIIIGGGYAVTFFFILSGFILTYNYHDWFSSKASSFDCMRFFRLRFARLAPLYVIGLLLDTPWHIIERARVGELANSALVFWASWLLNLLGLQAWVPGTPFAMLWNTPSWSISDEFFFYATFPFVSLWIARRFRQTGWLIAAFVFVIVASSIVYASVYYWLYVSLRVGELTGYIATSYTPLFRFPEFLAGCLIGRYFIETRDKTAYPGRFLFANTTSRSVVVSICVAIVITRFLMPPLTSNLALWLFDRAVNYSYYILPFSLIVLSIAKGRTILTSLLEQRWLVILGEASFGLYIVHWSFCSFLTLHIINSLNSRIVYFLFLLATIPFSLFCYFWIEVPLRGRLRGLGTYTRVIRPREVL